MKTSAGVGFVMAALCACMQPQGGTTTSGDSDSSSSGGAGTTVEDPTNVHETDPIQTVTSETDADPTTSSTGSGAETDTDPTTGDPDTGDVCPGLVGGIADMLTGPRCELVLRFTGDTALAGWHIACGEVPGADTYDEKSALEATKCCGDGVFLNDPIVSPFVVFLPPMDPADGGVAVVSNHLGTVVFDASVGIDGPGTISVPKPLGPADALADPDACSAAAFTFTGLAVYRAGDGNNPPDLETTLAAAIEATVLPAALAQAGATVDRGVLVGYTDQGQDESYVLVLELSVA